MAKARKIAHSDRVVNLRTGELARVIDVHDKDRTGTVNYSVLPDDGPRACVVWPADQVETP